MTDTALLRLQLAVFALVSACFTNIYNCVHNTDAIGFSIQNPDI